MTPTSTNLPRTLAQLMRAAFVDLHDYALAPEAENALASLREIADQLEAMPASWSDDTALLNETDAAKIVIGRVVGEHSRYVTIPSVRDALRAARDAATQNTQEG